MNFDISVILVEPETPGNIGFVARIMKNFGFKKLIIVNPKVRDFSEALIFSKHGYDILESAMIVESLTDVVTSHDLLIGTSSKIANDYNVLRSFIYPEDIIPSLTSSNGKIGLVFGRESIGLTNDELDIMDFLVTIPATEEYPVLNLSHAVAIILYEIYKHGAIQKINAKRNPIASELEKSYLIEFFSIIVNVLVTDEVKREIIIRSFKNVIGRSFITKREINSLLGVFRKASQLIKRSRKLDNK